LKDLNEIVGKEYQEQLLSFDHLRSYFSADDKGAQLLTEEEFCELSQSAADKIIGNVENFKSQARLQKIYNTSRRLLQGFFSSTDF
jgi:hypothetical protein